MKLKFQLLLLFCIIAVSANAQKQQSDSFNIGDTAPAIKVSKWIKGTPVQHFEKGKVYVLDFWATWCAPCRASLPYLSHLARKYKGKVTFIGMDVLDDDFYGPFGILKGTALINKITTFVDSMGSKMDFRVAMDDSDYMYHHWYKAFVGNGSGIPTDFIVNRQGKIVWIGNPVDLDGVLSKVVNNSWDIKKARAKRISDQHLEELDSEASDSLNSLQFKWNKLNDTEKADSMLSAIRAIIKKHPKLKYAPNVALFTFRSLLIANPAKACEYGKQVINLPSEDAPYYVILNEIKYYDMPHKLPGYIYGLGADLYQTILDNTSPVYKEISDTPNIYHTMAAWYRLAGDTLKAKEAEQKSFNTTIVQICKNKKDTASSDIVLYNDYALSDSTLDPRAIIDNKHSLKRIYKLYLDLGNSATIAVGRKRPVFWHILPGDTLIFEERNAQPDSLESITDFKMLNGAGLRLPNLYPETISPKPSPELTYGYEFDQNDADSIYQSWLKKAFNLNEIKKASQDATNEYMTLHPIYNKSESKKEYLNSWFEQMIFRENENRLFLNDRYLLHKDSIFHKQIDSAVLKLAADIDQQDQIKTINYWVAIRNIYNDILSKMAINYHYNIDSLEEVLKPFGDTTRQYIWLTMLADSNSSLIDDNLAWTNMASKIDFGEFQPYLKRYLSKQFVIGPEYLNVALRSVRLYDTAMHEIILDSVFRSTKQPYLLVGFYGTWDSASIKQIAAYSQDEKLNNSGNVRPVWLFFENDKEDWLKVIEKYNLPPQNCFFVKDYSIMKENFTSQFNWHSDFPHYFLFSREGRCIKQNTLSFSQFGGSNFRLNQHSFQSVEQSPA